MKKQKTYSEIVFGNRKKNRTMYAKINVEILETWKKENSSSIQEFRTLYLELPKLDVTKPVKVNLKTYSKHIDIIQVFQNHYEIYVPINCLIEIPNPLL